MKSRIWLQSQSRLWLRKFLKMRNESNFVSAEDKKARYKRNRQIRAAERRGPPVNRKIVAAKALSDRVMDLFSDGFNTLEIAAKVNAKESQVYNILARLAG